MKTEKSGNGVKVAKIVREVNEVINSNAKRADKLKLLAEIKDHSAGRPGNADALKIISKYEQKFKWFTSRSIMGQYPRGDNRIIKSPLIYGSKYKYNVRDSWAKSFESYLSKECPLVTVFLIDVFKLTDLYHKNSINPYNTINYNQLRPFSNKIREHYITLNKAQEKKKEIQNQFEQKTGLHFIYANNKSDIISVQRNKSTNAYRAEHLYCVVNGWYITVHHTQTEDWDYYAKSYNRPKITVERRWVNFFKNGKNIEHEVSSFAGNYLFNAIIEVLKLKPATLSKKVKTDLGKNLKKVQLNKYFKVINSGSKLGFHFYKRTFANDFYDYVVIDKHNNTYHAATKLACVQGLKVKLNTIAAFDNEIITQQTARQLGFCEFGINSFCQDNNIHVDEAYTRIELRNIVVNNRKINCQKYAHELKQLGITLSC